MFELPRNTILGRLSLQDTLEYFDFPRIFTCKSTTNQLYLVLSTFDDESECRWLYLPISSHRLNAVLTGNIGLQKAFKDPEDGFLLNVVTYAAERAPIVSSILPEEIDETDLPLPSYLLNAATILVNEEVIVDPCQVARASHRETFNYHIFPGTTDNHEIAARKLGGILTTTQELLDALGQASDGEPTVRGPLPVELLQKTRVNVSHVFRGSFGVQFRSGQYADLLDYSKVSDALMEFGNLLLAADSEDLLSNKLHSLRGRVASKYRRLLKELNDVGSGLLLDWGAVHPDRGGRFSLSSEQVKKAYVIVDRIDIAMAEEVVVHGQLIGFNSRTQRYEINSAEDGRNYAGKVATEARIQVAHPAIGDHYEAKLRMLIETQSTSGDELIRWVLVGLNSRT